MRQVKDNYLTSILIQWLFLSHTSFSSILSSVLWGIVQGLVSSSWILSVLHCPGLCIILPWPALKWGFPYLFWEERSRALWTAAHRPSRKTYFVHCHAGLAMENKAAVTKRSPRSCRRVILRDTGVSNGLCTFFPFQCANGGLLVKRWMKHIAYIWKILIFILDLHLVNILYMNTFVRIFHEVSYKKPKFASKIKCQPDFI